MEGQRTEYRGVQRTEYREVQWTEYRGVQRTEYRGVQRTEYRGVQRTEYRGVHRTENNIKKKPREKSQYGSLISQWTCPVPCHHSCTDPTNQRCK